MKILLVGATRSEIEPFVLDWENSSAEYPIVVEVLVTGVGMAATALQLGRKLTENPGFDLILNAGIAGSFDRNIALGTLVQIIEDKMVELGAETEEGFIDLEELGFGQNTYYASSQEDMPEKLKQASLIWELKNCKAFTVNKVHGRNSSIEKITQHFPEVQIESMEGAAVFLAASHFGIPCVQIRAVSNYVESRNRDNWQIPLAVRNLNSWLLQFFKAGKVK